MDIVVMDENRGKMDFAESASKFGSAVKINSIAVDISRSMETIESPAHEHFSIRGFVAGMRKKDLKTCFPFASVGNGVDSEGNLPPLYIPGFRWWQCSSCITNAEMKRISEKKVVVTRSDANTNSGDNVGGKKGAFIQRREKTSSKCKPYTRDKEAPNSCAIPEVNPQQVIKRLNNTPDMVCLVERPLCIVNEPDNASSGSDGSFSIIPHKRKPKLRSLADILVGKRSQGSSHYRTRSTLSCGSGMQVASTNMEAVFVPQLEVNVLADVSKSGRSLERKRKFSLGNESEDREPLAANCPRAAAKKLKGLLVDGEENSRRVKFVVPESKGGASIRLDVLRTEWIKPQKAKAIDASKRVRRIHRDDEIGQIIEYPQPKAVSSTNIQDQTLPMKTTLGNFGAASSSLEIRHALVETRPCFRNSLSRKQVDEIGDLSMASMPEVGADGGHLTPLRKSILVNRNIRGNVALDQALDCFMEGDPNDQESCREQRCIPDLNMEIPEKTALTEGQQFTILSEERNLPLHKKLDAASSSNEKVWQGKLEMGISEPKNKDNNNVILGASDNIPMEIVELLARNKHERSLGNSKRHLLGINNSTRGYSAGNADQHPGTINFPHPSRMNGFSVKNGNMGVGTNVSRNFPQLKHCQLDTNRLEKDHFKPISLFTLSQPRKPEYSTSTSTMEATRSGSGAELLWQSARENLPFRLSNRLIQPFGMHAHSFSDQCHKGKDGKGKKSISDVAKLKEGRAGSIYPPIGSLDRHSNDTIPAMQLLSLMDRRVKSGTSLEVGTKCSLDKPFSPCKHHPPLNGKENNNFLYHSLFPQNSSSKDSTWLRYGVYSSGESSERASSDSRVQVPQELRNLNTTILDGSRNLEKRPAGSNGAFGECVLNRNPADFSFPGEGNQFTLTAKDLKPRRRNALKVKLAAGKMDGRKRQRMRKKSSEKELLRSHDLTF